jgi:hypothetical protein
MFLGLWFFSETQTIIAFWVCFQTTYPCRKYLFLLLLLLLFLIQPTYGKHEINCSDPVFLWGDLCNL